MADLKKKSNKKSKRGNTKGNKVESRSKEFQNKINHDTPVADNDADRGTYGGNDVSWYTRYPDLTKAAAQVPFAFQPGRELPFSVNPPQSDDSSLRENKPIIYPGIMSIKFIPTVGTSTDIASPINVAAREVYGRIRSKYSGSLEADAPDIMMYLLALDSLYMLYEDMKRAYYCINQYTPYNTLYPKAIIKALGYDFDDLMTNKVYLFQCITEAGAMLSKFMIPDTMDLFKRHQFMVSNIYADSPTKKSQQYVFVLDQYYELNNVDTMTTLKSIKWGDDEHQYKTVESAWSMFKKSMKILMSWDTSYTILGYLERAYEGTSFLLPTPVLENGLLSPVYNSEIMLQIQNATAIKLLDGTNDVYQDPTNENVLLCGPSADTPYEEDVIYNGFPVDALISIPTDDQPTPEEIIIATRLTSVVENGSSITCGTEIVTGISMILRQEGAPEGNIPETTTSFLTYTGHKTGEFSNFNSMLRYSALLSAFDRHPHINLVIYNASTDSTYNWMWTTMSNITTTTPEVLSNLHRMCVYSEFNCFNN